MDLLLDTHIFLWYVWGDPQLSQLAKALIENEANTKYVSVVSIWEIAIKVSIGKMTLARPFADFITERLDGNGFVTLEMKRTHVEQTVSLPFHHRDPFDRLILAQSICEDMPIISADGIFDAYSVKRLW